MRSNPANEGFMIPSRPSQAVSTLTEALEDSGDDSEGIDESLGGIGASQNQPRSRSRPSQATSTSGSISDRLQGGISRSNRALIDKGNAWAEQEAEYCKEKLAQARKAEENDRERLELERSRLDDEKRARRMATCTGIAEAILRHNSTNMSFADAMKEAKRQYDEEETM